MLAIRQVPFSCLNHDLIELKALVLNYKLTQMDFKQLFCIGLGCISTLCYSSEPKDVVAEFHAALASGDQSRAAGLLAPDITIYESGFVERSRAEYVNHHLPEDIAFAKTSTHTFLKQSEQQEGNLAIVLGETETNAKIKNADVRLLGTETMILRKKGENWVITHIHWSSRKSK